MIEVTRINGTKFMINIDLIETVEESPDTVITMVSGKKVIVKETKFEIKELIIEFKRQLFSNQLR